MYAIDYSSKAPVASPIDLLTLIEKTRTERGCLKITANDKQYVLINLADSLWYDEHHLLAMIAADQWVNNLIIEHPSLGETRKQAANLTAPRPLEDLWWIMAYAAADESTFQHYREQYNCRRDDVIRLNRWPNFTRIGASPVAIKLAALFSARPTSVYLASKILHIAADEVERFYIAACASGFVERVNRPTAIVTPVTHKHQSLIKGLFQHLSRAYGRS